jgi:hypothetical protein
MHEAARSEGLLCTLRELHACWGMDVPYLDDFCSALKILALGAQEVSISLQRSYTAELN